MHTQARMQAHTHTHARTHAHTHTHTDTHTHRHSHTRVYTEHKITAGQRTFFRGNTIYQGIFKFLWKKCPREGLVN